MIGSPIPRSIVPSMSPIPLPWGVLTATRRVSVFRVRIIWVSSSFLSIVMDSRFPCANLSMAFWILVSKSICGAMGCVYFCVFLVAVEVYIV